MAWIPDDIILDILLRLPVKSLLRFMCVSKTWFAMIHDKDFEKKHLNRSIGKRNNHNLISPGRQRAYIHSVGLYLLDKTIQLAPPINKIFLVEQVGSCNGLICYVGFSCEDVIVIWNPSTRKHVKLPYLAIDYPDGDFEIKQTVYGFGYDSVYDDYKVVRVIEYCSQDGSFNSRFEADVYSLRSDSWRRTRDFPSCRICQMSGSAVQAYGALHWMAITYEPGLRYFYAASFDLVTEEYSLVPLPDHLSIEEYPCSLASLGGCLCIVFRIFDITTAVFSVWLKDYGIRESWTKLLTISYPQISRPVTYVIPLAYSESGSEVLMVTNFGQPLWYNLENRMYRLVDVHGYPGFDSPLMICFEGLVSLGEKAENDGKICGEKEAKAEPNEKVI